MNTGRMKRKASWQMLKFYVRHRKPKHWPKDAVRAWRMQRRMKRLKIKRLRKSKPKEQR